MNSLQQLPHWQFAFSLLSIIVVDLTLSGDNAVVVAAAAKSLPSSLRKRALFAGAACAVATLVVAAFFATRLLHVKFLQVVGGMAILWIADRIVPAKNRRSIFGDTPGPASGRPCGLLSLRM